MRPKKQLSKLLFDTSHKQKLVLNSLVSSSISELSGVQFRTLGFIQRCTDEGITVFQKDIEKELKLKGSSVTSLLNNLEQSGFILRQSVKGDKRKNEIVLTEKANVIRHKMEVILEDFEKSIADGFSEDELNMFVQLLNRMSENIDKIKE